MSDGIMFGYVCQICGEHREIILSRCSKTYPVAICPECAKKIEELTMRSLRQNVPTSRLNSRRIISDGTED